MSSLAWDQLTQGFERGPSRCDKVWTAESHVAVLLHARLPSPLHGMLFVTAPRSGAFPSPGNYTQMALTGRGFFDVTLSSYASPRVV